MRHTPLRRNTLIRRYAVVAVAILVLTVNVIQAMGASTTQLRTIYIREDSFRNFDFRTTWNSPNNVDWAISMLFWNNAEVDKVKNRLKPYYYWEGGPMRALINNGNGWQWDSDSGKKQVKCIAVGDSVHYRIYAPPSDRFYNLSWGYYTLVSTHIDHNECNFWGKWHGASEKAERHITNTAKAVYGWQRVQYHWSSFHNYMPTFNQGDHHWENDGAATSVKVP